MLTISKLLKFLLKSKKVYEYPVSEDMKCNSLLTSEEYVPPIRKEEQGDNVMVPLESIPPEGPIKLQDITPAKITKEAPPSTQDFLIDGAQQNTPTIVEVVVEITEQTIAKHTAKEGLPETQTVADRPVRVVYHIKKSGSQKELKRNIKRVAKEMAFCVNNSLAGSTSEKEIVKSLREFVGAQPSPKKIRHYRTVAKLLYMQEFDPACLTEPSDETEM